MKKGVIALSSILIVGVITLFSINLEKEENVLADAPKKKNVVVFEGKTDGFDSLEDLEGGSDIIIKGIKTGEVETVVTKSEIDDEVNGGFTVSDFKISEVFKTDSNSKIEVENNVSILENAFYDQETEATYTVNGYEKMIEGEEYLLFLSSEVEGVFAPEGVTYGKVPLNTNKVEMRKFTSHSRESNNEHVNELDQLFKEAREKYQ